MSFYHNPRVITDGLVLYFDAKNNKSAVSGSGYWKDLITGNKAVLTNTPIYNSEGYYTFDSGSSQYGTFTSIRSTLTGNRTVSVWAYPTIPDKRQTIVADWHTNGGIGVGIRESNQIAFAYRAVPEESWQYFGSATEIQYNQWYNFTGVYDGNIGNEKVYTNGNKETTAEIIGLSTSYGAIGRRDNGSNYWSGHIAVIQFYNRALTEIEVKQNYIATKGRFGK